MGPRDHDIDFEEAVSEALDSLPDDLRRFMSNVELVVEDEPPPGLPLLGLYQGVPLTRRTSFYAGVPPEKTPSTRGRSSGCMDRIPSGSGERFAGSCCTRSHTTSGSATSVSASSTATDRKRSARDASSRRSPSCSEPGRAARRPTRRPLPP